MDILKACVSPRQRCPPATPAPSSPQQPPYNLTSGPVAGSAGAESTGPQDTPPSDRHYVQHQGGCPRKICPGHLPSSSSHSKSQGCVCLSSERYIAGHCEWIQDESGVGDIRTMHLASVNRGSIWRQRNLCRAAKNG